MKLILGVTLILACWLSLAYSLPTGVYTQRSQPEGYFQYINVPGHKQYEYGFKKGNPHHFISRFEQAKDHTFRTRVKWADTHGGTGEHYWEYNHGPKHDYKSHDTHDPYGHPQGYHSENIKVVVPAHANRGQFPAE